MTLTLTRAFEIDIKLIPVEEDKALLLARRRWEFDGRPIEPLALRRSLERVLTLCQREGARYPAILRRRKKELERGTWVPPGSRARHLGGACRRSQLRDLSRNAKRDPATPEQAVPANPAGG